MMQLVTEQIVLGKIYGQQTVWISICLKMYGGKFGERITENGP